MVLQENYQKSKLLQERNKVPFITLCQELIGSLGDWHRPVKNSLELKIIQLLMPRDSRRKWNPRKKH